MINLAINGCQSSFVVINGQSSTVTEIDSSDIFIENMRNFITAIKQNDVTKDTDKLTKHVAVILAVQKSIETGAEERIEN